MAQVSRVTEVWFICTDKSQNQTERGRENTNCVTKRKKEKSFRKTLQAKREKRGKKRRKQQNSLNLNNVYKTAAAWLQIKDVIGDELQCSIAVLRPQHL